MVGKVEMNFRKLALFLGVLAVMFALVACGAGDEGGSGDTGQESTAAQAPAKTQGDTRARAAVPQDKSLILSIPKMGRGKRRGHPDRQRKRR